MAQKHMKSRKKRLTAMQRIGRPGPASIDLVYLRTNGHCWYCGEHVPMADATHDHLVPIIAGGTTTLENLVMACRACNGAKGHLSLDAYRAQCGGTTWQFYGERSHTRIRAQ